MATRCPVPHGMQLAVELRRQERLCGLLRAPALGRGPTGTAHTTLLEGERCVFGQGIRIHLEPHGMERA